MFKSKEKKKLDKYKKIIEKSGLFDSSYYLRYNHDARIASETPIDHFIKYGIKEERKPNIDFDPFWYREYYQDIKDDGVYPFVHYIIHGRKEYRFINEREKKEYEDLKNKNFDIEFYKNSYEDLEMKEEDFDFLLHYIRYGRKEERSSIRYVDAGSLKNINKEERIFKKSILKSLDVINQPNNLDTGEQQAYNIIKKLDIDWSKYFIFNSHPFKSKDPIIDYIINFKEYEPLIPDFFDTAYYLAMYSDIRECGINPLIHFSSAGKNEGRVALFNQDHIEQGHLKYIPEKETLVFVSHESSATGAPLLGYSIADKLAKKYNIIHIVIKKSNIHDDFLNTCDLMLHDIQQNVHINSYIFMKQILKKRPIKCVMVNSIVGHQVVDSARELGLPTVVLIHEFSEYMRPFGTMINTVIHSDHVVVPATIIQDSIQKEFKRFANYKNVPTNIHILPQGKLPYIPETYGNNDSADDLYKKLKINPTDNVKIIVASGWVQIRKGVDLFILIARYIKKLYDGNCKFVWVGEGFDPDDDLAYSVYLDREIEFSGLGDDFIFLEHQKNLDTIFSIADVFCLTSRMDPFPNVVIDALAQDLHVACFDHASGSAEFLQKHNANATIVDFVDTYELATGVVNYLNSEDKKEEVNKKILDEHLNFDRYVNDLDTLVLKAAEFKIKSQEIVNKLLESNEFDDNFYHGEGTLEVLCREYVEGALKGFHFQNPKIGFSEIKWLNENSQYGLNAVPLYEALKIKNTSTHNVVQIPYEKVSSVDFIYAVHLHLYYVDLREIFAEYFSKLPGTYDIFVTIVDEDVYDLVKETFSVCNARSVKIVCVENIGRDSGPLFFSLKDKILNADYDVIGHFHSKKSLDMATGSGDKWLTYLMENLIGDTDVAQSVLEVFNDPEIGLIFPEDSNTSDIGENSLFVANLCKMLNIPPVKQTPLFPMGNMFWARVDAIKELFELEETKILQQEPLPYDGSYMHAIERITPSLVEKNGYKYVTVYKKGTQWV